MASADEIIDDSLARINEALRDGDVFLRELKNAASRDIYAYFTEPVIAPNKTTSLEVSVTDSNPTIPAIFAADNLSLSNLEDKLAYTTENLDHALAVLKADIDEGGYGIRAEDELTLWDRGRDRISKASQTELDAAERSASTRGFSLPPGTQFMLSQRAAQSVNERLAELNREISIKRADLLVAQRNFALGQTLSAGVSLAQVKLSEWSSTIETAKLQLSASIENARNAIEKESLRLKANDANNSARYNAARLSVEEWAKYSDNYFRRAQTLVDQARIQVDSAFKSVDANLEASKKGVDLYSSLVTAAQNSLTAIATLAE